MDGAHLLPLIGVVAGATIQVVLSRVGESTKAKSTLRVQAYVDYFASLSDSAYLSLCSDEAGILARAANAKTRISIYGSADVVAALAAFEKAGAQTGSSRSTHSGPDLHFRYARLERGKTTKSVK